MEINTSNHCSLFFVASDLNFSGILQYLIASLPVKTTAVHCEYFSGGVSYFQLKKALYEMGAGMRPFSKMRR